MQVQIDIGFSQLVQIVEALPPTQLKRLRVAIDQEIQVERPQTEEQKLLLAFPVATEDDTRLIDEKRQHLDQ